MSGDRWFTEENAKSAWDTGTSTLKSVWDGVSGWAGRNPGWAKGIGMFFGGILALNLMENMQWKFWIPAMIAVLAALDVGTSAWTDHAQQQERDRQWAEVPAAERGRRFAEAQRRLDGGGYSSSSGQSSNTETPPPAVSAPGLVPGG